MPPCRNYRSRRKANSVPPAAKHNPAVGELGLVLLRYIGTEPDTFYGPFTGAPYPFGEKATMYVDARDALEMDDRHEFEPG